MKTILKAILVLSCSLFQSEVLGGEPAADERWKPFQFLIGDWVGTGSGQPGQGSGEFSLKFDLNQKILVRRNRNQLAPKVNETVGATHEDLMIIYLPRGESTFRAEYFDNEGNVIHYAVAVSEHRIVFESAESGSAPKFKLTYDLKPDGILGIDFAIAQSGKPFQTYVKGTARRK